MYIDEEGLGVGENGGAFKEILCYFTGNIPTCLLTQVPMYKKIANEPDLLIATAILHAWEFDLSP